jgi:tetratricopeptide (TPR) repeat protein
MKASEAVPVAVQPGIPSPPLPLPSSLDGGGEVTPAALPEPAPELTAEVTESPKPTPRGKPAVAIPVASKQQNDEALREARQLLHAQRYVEARTAFEKLLAAKPTKGAALAGLAQIAFQEKNYKEAVERAKESARTGGGVEARVLLGDAYFKLDRFEEAKKAYNEALKLDPNNRVAGQGLRLVESQ